MNSSRCRWRHRQRFQQTNCPPATGLVRDDGVPALKGGLPRIDPPRVTVAAILLFVLAGSLLLFSLIALGKGFNQDDETSVSASLLFTLALAVLVAGILVLRRNQAGRVLAY